MTTLAQIDRESNCDGSLADCIRTEADWFVCDVPQRPRSRPELFALLFENHTMAGSARYCLSAGGALVFRADIPRPYSTDRDAEVPADSECVASDAADISAIIGCLLSDTQTDELNPARLCEQAGWPCADRSSGKVAVDLETRNPRAVAIVAPTANGLRISVDLHSIGDAAALAPQSRDAIALFLLRLASAVRMIHPVAHPLDDRTVIGLSVHVPPVNSALHLSNGLAALSVAADLSRAECRALTQPDLAAAYLATIEPRQ